MSPAPDATLAKAAANTLRFLSVDAVEKAKSGHPGLPMGAADVAFVLWSRFLRYDPTAPDWADRDRFVLSAGHGCDAPLFAAAPGGVRPSDVRAAGVPAVGEQDAGASRSSATPSASRRRPGRWVRGSPMRSAWRSPGRWRPRGSTTPTSSRSPTASSRSGQRRRHDGRDLRRGVRRSPGTWGSET